MLPLNPCTCMGGDVQKRKWSHTMRVRLCWLMKCFQAPEVVALTSHLLPENFSVANGPQLQNLVLADKLWFSTLLR